MLMHNVLNVCKTKIYESTVLKIREPINARAQKPSNYNKLNRCEQ